MSKQKPLSKEMLKAARTPTHQHSWELNVGDGIYAVCEAPYCHAQLDWDEAEKCLNECDAWKEAFTATRAYYSNNNGENARHYREAIKQVKEMKLLK